MQTEAQIIWNDVLKVIKLNYDDGKTLPWFNRLIPVKLDETHLYCKTQLSFTIRAFNQRYKTLAEEILEQISMESLELIIEEDPEAPVSFTESIMEQDLKSKTHTELSSSAEGNTNPELNLDSDKLDSDKSADTLNLKPESDKSGAQSTQNQAISVYFDPERGQYINAQTNEPLEQPQRIQQLPQGSTQAESNMEPQINYPADLNKRTFETFVAGDSNNAAMVSAQRVAEMPGRVFNPFFLYSKSGLGKTHLLMAIKNYVEEYYPSKRVLYVTSEQFLQDYIKELAESKKKQTGQPIMTEYRSVDVLLVDDIQFFEGKNESQEYFFATFEELTRRGAQIVLSADRSPKDLRMDERMTSRFQSGLCQSIQPPSYELKLAILKTFYKRNLQLQPWFQADLSDELLRYIAEVSSSNIREIEGFLTNVMVKASGLNKNGSPISKQDINTLAAESFNLARKVIEISTIQREVAKYYQLSRDDIIGPDRHKNINHARQVAMYLSRELTDASFASVGKSFGGRDHTTIMNGVQNIEQLVKKDRNFFDDLEKLKDLIRQMS